MGLQKNIIKTVLYIFGAVPHRWPQKPSSKLHFSTHKCDPGLRSLLQNCIFRRTHCTWRLISYLKADDFGRTRRSEGCAPRVARRSVASPPGSKDQPHYSYLGTPMFITAFYLARGVARARGERKCATPSAKR